MNKVSFESLQGKIFTKIETCNIGSDIITFHCNDGTIYEMFHEQDCSERVQIEDVCGDIEDLLGSPILKAVESSLSDDDDDDELAKLPTIELSDDEASFTWTFYILSTIKGTVTLRWLGQSNGCYSEKVSIFKDSSPDLLN